LGGHSTQPDTNEIYKKAWKNCVTVAKKYNVRLRHINDIGDDELKLLDLQKAKEENNEY
jgi:hypothetical protein